jgi:hypothetical protein
LWRAGKEVKAMPAIEQFMKAQFFERWRWWVGIPRDFWVVNVDFIGQFIKKNGLNPVEAEHLGGSEFGALPMAEGNRAATVAWKPRPFPGGLRAPHLHFKGDLFQLSREQWADFSKTVMKGFSEKLSRAGTVTFDKVIEVSDAIDTIG